MNLPAPSLTVGNVRGRRSVRAGLALAALAVTASSASAGAASGQTFVVTTTADSGSGSLRQAILDANANPGADVIRFGLPGSGVQTIAVTSAALPAVTDPVVINGRSQPGFAGSPLVRVDNPGGRKWTGLRLDAGSSQVLGLEVTRFTVGLRLAGDGEVVAGNLVGTDAAGSAGLGNSVGVRVVSGSGDLIGGTGSGARNVISGNASAGVEIAGASSSGVKVAGNVIGTDPAGSVARANGVGVRIAGSAGNTVGGTMASARNLISGNTGTGVDLAGGGTSGTTVLGNYIGTDPAGSASIPNRQAGVLVEAGASGNTIGGTSAGARNLISGNIFKGGSAGVVLTDAGTSQNTVEGDWIGLDASGTAALGNRDGVVLRAGAGGNTIGGTTAGARNVISGNQRPGVAQSRRAGIRIEWDAGANTVAGNYIGTDTTGTSAIANDIGVWTFGSGSTIGGGTSGVRNVISGNRESGIEIDSGSGNTVAGDYIGTNASGNAPLPNDTGVWIAGGSSTNTIGGASAGARNVISGNASIGADVNGQDCNLQNFNPVTDNTVAGNYIGTDAGGTTAIGNHIGVRLAAGAADNVVGGVGSGNLISGNDDAGVLIEDRAGVDCDTGDSTSTGNSVVGNLIGTDRNGVAAIGGGGVVLEASHNLIGGTAPGAGNVIAWTDSGVDVSGNYDSILGNSIFSNDGLGISLDGANHGQAAPSITSVVTAAGSTTIGGTLSSTPSTQFRIELFSSPSCDASGAGEGRVFLGSVDATTNGSGNATFSTSVPALPSGQSVTGTATSSDGDTSEFSTCFTSP